MSLEFLFNNILYYKTLLMYLIFSGTDLRKGGKRIVARKAIYQKMLFFFCLIYTGCPILKNAPR